mgnify:CR=1 FL=1
MRQPLFLCLIQEKSHVHRQGKDILGIANVVISYFLREFSEKLPIFQGLLADIFILPGSSRPWNTASTAFLCGVSVEMSASRLIMPA